VVVGTITIIAAGMDHVLRRSIQTKYHRVQTFQHGSQGNICDTALRLIAAANGGEDRGIMLGQKESLKVTTSKKVWAVVNPLAGSMMVSSVYSTLFVYH